MGWDENMRGGYNGEYNPDVWQGQTWPCGKFENGDFKSYFGRGAKQLSYKYNYGPFSQAMFGDVRVLLDNPDMVADTWLNLASAVFFFVYIHCHQNHLCYMLLMVLGNQMLLIKQIT
ncbi:glycoside hydrolase family 19 protein, partial [Francisella orientalis]|uniref:glycoside hydrolase family 19 protein n=1 Tax=Francisella orientalis TaxID=299583 RepID=UPI00025D4F35